MRTARFLVLAVLICGSAFALQPDKPGCSDHPLFPTRMPNYRIETCETIPFAAFDFALAQAKKRTVEGRRTKITYAVEKREDDQGALAVVRNYENAIKKIGGTVAFSDPNRWVNGSVVVDGREVWFQAERGNGKIWLTIVEKHEMAQQIVADAASFREGLASTGHVAVYGIYFDTNMAVVKSDSEPALLEIKKLLEADPSLTLWVVGHTDSTGSVESNMTLSEARAEAVVTALTTKFGVAAARLSGHGVGPLSPVATNGTEEGRAKNRRVELVKR